MTAQQSNASKEQELQAAENKTKHQTEAAGQVQDKRLNGPNRPSV